MAKIAPSILSADFAKLGKEVSEICSYDIDYLHIDVMDGLFVPNISFGPAVMKSLDRYASVPYDVHLMIDAPDRYLERFVTENTEFITVHQEACRHINRTVEHIHEKGVKAGVALNPGTPINILDSIFEYIDLLVIMSVNPGFGGQKFIPNTLEKVRLANEIRKKNGYKFLIEVDGGVNPENANEIKMAGGDVLVAGSAVFKSGNRSEAISSMR